MSSRILMAYTAPLLSGVAANADVFVSNKPTQNMTCDAGVCTATARKAVLNVADLRNMLASGNVTVKTGAVAKNLDFDQPLDWTGGSVLTLDAQRSVIVRKAITAAGPGALTVVYSDGDSGGDLQFFGNGKIDLPNPGSTLVINGSAYVLVYDIAGLASGVESNPSGHFALAFDYDTQNELFKNSPISSFGGSFEGLGHAIDHLTIVYRSGEQYVGFFGFLSGIVRDIALTHEWVRAHDADFAGGLVGINTGQIIHARVTGKISGQAFYAGGLVGDNAGSVSTSSAAVTVEGQTVGGLVGNNDGTIDQSFASTKAKGPGGGLIGLQNLGATANAYALGQVLAGGGGLVGVGSLNVSSSYSASQVAQIPFSGGFVGGVWGNAAQNAYWDVDTSGQTEGCGDGDCSGVVGLADAQLKSGLPAGFDAAIWGQSPKINDGYPYLLANPPPK